VTHQNAIGLAVIALSALSACYPTQKYVIDVRDSSATPSSVAQPSTIRSSSPSAKVARNYESGPAAIESNPRVSAEQAYAVCEPQADMAQRAASSAVTPRSYGTSTRCTKDYFGDYDCNSSAVTGGAWGGIASGLEASSAGRQAYDDVMSSCLASFGLF
jgi:hypothetical protein